MESSEYSNTLSIGRTYSFASYANLKNHNGGGGGGPSFLLRKKFTARV